MQHHKHKKKRQKEKINFGYINWLVYKLILLTDRLFSRIEKTHYYDITGVSSHEYQVMSFFTPQNGIKLSLGLEKSFFITCWSVEHPLFLLMSVLSILWFKNFIAFLRFIGCSKPFLQWTFCDFSASTLFDSFYIKKLRHWEPRVIRETWLIILSVLQDVKSSRVCK